MLFMVWTLVWLTQATMYPMLVVPATAYVVRAGYLDRPIFERIHILPLLVALGVFVALLSSDSEMTTYNAGLYSARILTSSLILIHVSRGLRSADLKIYGATIGTLIVIAQRCLAIERRFIMDATYTFSIRWRYSIPSTGARLAMWAFLASLAGAIACVISLAVGAGNASTTTIGIGLGGIAVVGVSLLALLNKGWKTRARLLGGIIKTIAMALDTLSEDMNHLYNVRSRLPITRGWTVPPLRRMPIFVADTISVIVIVAIAITNADVLVPQWLVSFFAGALPATLGF